MINFTFPTHSQPKPGKYGEWFEFQITIQIVPGGIPILAFCRLQSKSFQLFRLPHCFCVTILALLWWLFPISHRFTGNRHKGPGEQIRKPVGAMSSGYDLWERLFRDAMIWICLIKVKPNGSQQSGNGSHSDNALRLYFLLLRIVLVFVYFVFFQRGVWGFQIYVIAFVLKWKLPVIWFSVISNMPSNRFMVKMFIELLGTVHLKHFQNTSV